MEERKFFFAATDELVLEQWTIFIEFTRAKAIYDEFVNNFGKIQFPIGSYQDHMDVSLAFEISNLGRQLKTGATGIGGTMQEKPFIRVGKASNVGNLSKINK